MGVGFLSIYRLGKLAYFFFHGLASLWGNAVHISALLPSQGLKRSVILVLFMALHRWPSGTRCFRLLNHLHTQWKPLYTMSSENSATKEWRSHFSLILCLYKTLEIWIVCGKKCLRWSANVVFGELCLSEEHIIWLSVNAYCVIRRMFLTPNSNANELLNTNTFWRK